MSRFTEGVRAPAGLAGTVRAARQRRRRRVAIGGAVSCTASVAAVAVIAVTALAPTPPAHPGAALQARETAYVVHRVERALAHNLVFRGTSNSMGQLSVTWAYGTQNRFLEFTGNSCGHSSLSGDCTHRGGSGRYLANGTTFVHGKLTGIYLTYWDRRYSLARVWAYPPSACSAEAAQAMGGPGVPTAHWSVFIRATIACGAARVTGHVLIDGVETTKITGKPVSVKLSPGYAKVSHEKWSRSYWTLYVDPTTYLPVRMSGSTRMSGGPMASYTSSSVTDVQWLPATRANIARASVTIPAGFHRWRGSPGNQ
jgi:hypothetical protein